MKNSWLLKTELFYVAEAYAFMLKKCKNQKQAACLFLDDMHIMKKLEKCGKVVTGGMDMGERGNSVELAKMALILMVHSIHEKWKKSRVFLSRWLKGKRTEKHFCKP